MSVTRSQDPWGDRLLRVDFLAGVVVGIIAVAIWMQAWNLPMGEIRNFGPGFLPKLFGAGLAVGATALTAWGLLQPPSQAERVKLAFRGPVVVTSGILFFALFIRGWQVGPIAAPQLGLMIVAPVTVVLTGFGSREGNARELLVLGFGLTALGTLLFADLLNLRLPLFPQALEPWIFQTFGFEWSRRYAYAAYALITLGLAHAFGFKLLGSARDKESGA
ncbi:MAG TPA: tripartite tricarboxylate transporter TctB family protein [Devosiaceae bacterium]|jgi:hypothetical protein|nr:tripartite tricarboxylate transporter TctB family protein [Devosiaceae bacterium]